MFSSHEFIYIFIGDHAAIADEHDAMELESLVQIADDFLHGVVVHGVAGPDVMSDRPASHHDDADDDLHVLRLAVATVTVFGEVGWSGPLEVCAGDVVEHQVWPKAEEVAETVIKSQLDLFFGGQELIESTVPGFQLAEVNADPVMLMPVWEKTSTLAVTHEVGLEPASQTMFAAGMDQAIGDQHKCSIDEGDTFSFAEVGFENRPETELCEQGTDGEYRSPGGGIEDLWVR